MTDDPKNGERGPPLDRSYDAGLDAVAADFANMQLASEVEFELALSGPLVLKRLGRRTRPAGQASHGDRRSPGSAAGSAPGSSERNRPPFDGGGGTGGGRGPGGGRDDPRPLRVVDVAALEGTRAPERRWLIPDWIPWGAVTALYGDGGVGKSLLAQQLMTCSVARRSFLQMPIESCKALGVFCEDDADELHRRQERINAKLELGMADLDGLYWMSRVADDNLLMTFAGDGRGEATPFLEQLLDWCPANGVNLVVIDTAADTFGGNENARPAVRQFLSAGLGRLAQAIDGTVVLLAHPSLTGLSSGQGSGGSTAWNNSVRSRLFLSWQSAQDNGDDGDNGPSGDDQDLRILSRKKSNYARAGDELRMRYEDGAFVAVDAPEVDTGMWRVLREREADRMFVEGLETLRELGFNVNIHRNQKDTYAPRAIRAKVQGGAEFTERELAGAMDRLIRDGRIRSLEEGPASRKRSRLVVVADPDGNDA